MTSALNLVREGLDEARRSVLDLRAAPLDNLSLSNALRHVADKFTEQTGIQVLVQVDPVLPDLSADAETAILRIAQEGLSNAHKHGQASSARVALHAQGQTLHLEVQDGGCGFDADRVNLSGRFGLVGMRERARLLGGELRVESAEGEGTLLSVALPLLSRIGEQG